MRVVYAVILLIVAVATLVFCLQNMESVTVKFAGSSMVLPLPILVLIVYLIGMVSGWSVLSFLRRSIHGLTDKPNE